MMIVIALVLACAPATVTVDDSPDFGPGQPVGLEDAEDLAVGDGWVCSSDRAGSVSCDDFDAPGGDWYSLDGDWGTLCAVGNGNDGRCWGDVEASPGRVEQIAAGDGFACWLRLDIDGGELECIGDIASPPEGSSWMDLAAGGEVACALSDEGEVTCWGDRDFTDGSGWDRIAVGPDGGVCVLRLPWQSQDRDARCWGLSSPDPRPLAYSVTVGMGGGYLESAESAVEAFAGANAPSEDHIAELSGVVASHNRACAIVGDGGVYCWD